MPDGSDKPAKGGPKAVSDALDSAKTRPRRVKAAPPPEDPPPPPPDDNDGDDDSGGGGGAGGAGWFRVPDDCPVTPLGIDADSKRFLFMDANRLFVAMQSRDFGGHGLSALFGDEEGQEYLDRTWPRVNARGEASGLDKERASRSLMAACASKGVFDSDNRIRSVGAWTDDDGSLIWHLGDTILVVARDGTAVFKPVGLIGARVYPEGVVQRRPDSQSGNPAKSVMRLYELLQTWHWKRGLLDARLQLGWLGCALIGGALRWRPAVWATGGNGTGKSSLHEFIVNPVLGGTPSVVETADATGPGLYQALRNRSTPVMFDELEPDPESRARVESTIKLAKISASGGRIVRGSPDGTHKEFVARAAFLFSSILIPRLEPEVAMRICVLDLLALGERKEPKIEPREMAGVGQDLRRRLVERWAHWPVRLERWRQAFRAEGFSARVADTWGTLLAMADHLLSAEDSAEDAPDDVFAEWIDLLKPYLKALVEASGSDHVRLLQTMLTKLVDPYAKGQRWPLSTVLAIACSRKSASEDESQGELTLDRAVSGLEALGMKVMAAKRPLPDDAPDDAEQETVMCLAVASSHTEINGMLKDTKWGRGVYTQTLLRIPGAWSAQQRIARHKIQCAMIPLDVVLPPAEPGSDLLTT